jgi:hypothetical protein
MSLIIHLQFGCNSSLFLFVFFNSWARISLLGEVNCARPVDNKMRRGGMIEGFEMCCFGSH